MMGEQEGIISQKGYADPVAERFDWRCPDLPSVCGEANMLLSTCDRRRRPGGGCFGVACSAISSPKNLSGAGVSRPLAVGCSVDGCDGDHVAKGLCYHHYWDRQKRLRRERAASRSKKVKGCSVEGCDGKHSAKGFCSKHYRTPKQLAAGLCNVAEECLLPGCDVGQYRGGFCRAHYYQAHRQKSGLTLRLFKISMARGVSPDALLNLLSDGGC